MTQVPIPDYRQDAEELRKHYEKALKDIQKEIANVIGDTKKAHLLSAEANIKGILSDILKYGNEWASHSIEKSAKEGVARTLVEIGYVSTFDEAINIVKFSQTNRQLTDKAISDVQSDLLAMTNNMQRQSILAVRKATSKAVAAKLSSGINATRDISKAIQRELNKITDLAIIDSANRRWTVSAYSDVLARTKLMEAHKSAAIQAAVEEERFYGRISRHQAKDACRLWEGKVVKFKEDAPGDYPFIGNLPRKEIFHPNCRHLVSAIRTPDEVRGLLNNEVPTTKEGTSNNFKKENEVAAAEFDRLTTTKTTLSSNKTELRKHLKELLGNSEIEGTVSIKKLDGSYGQVTFSQSGADNHIKVKSFALNSDHLTNYTFEQTLYHEFYHARYDGLHRGNMPLELWFDYEETATELASLYMTKRKGYALPEIPAYSDILVRNLPLLKQMEEFAGLENVIDFGENFLKYRFHSEYMTADWSFLADKVEKARKTFDFDKYARDNYEQYVRDNIDDIALGLALHHGVKDVSLVKRLIIGYVDGERTQGRQFYDAVLVAMMQIGVK